MSEHITNHYLLFLTIPKWAQIGKFDRHTAHFFWGRDWDALRSCSKMSWSELMPETRTHWRFFFFLKMGSKQHKWGY